jgi:hypothetical protein
MVKQYIILLFLILSILGTDTALFKSKEIFKSDIITYSTRLHPNQDIMTELLSLAK